MIGIFKKIFGDFNSRKIKEMQFIVDDVAELDAKFVAFSDYELQQMTPQFKQRLADGETLDAILPEAFAVCREAAKRVLGMRHFDVQLMGGIVLHSGNIAEMGTGEGKTLVATLAVYLNALTGKGVHVITVNDYLASRDSQWMGKLYHFLGLSVGLNVHGLDFDQKKAAYNADITYGTNNEFGFDYLRDNMVIHPDQMVQRELNFAIVDEVDSILIDEARTPLIISGPGEKSTDLYYQFARIVPRLTTDDYTVDEKARTVAPTESGIAKAEKALGVSNMYDNANIELSHCFNQALRAHALMHRDKDYVVKDGEVIIVDEFTGRLMFGRRYSDGLHQAIEAKENVKIERESQTLATITFQNYFRMYDKLSGMTGTAATEAEEFRKIYGLEVITIPTNKPMARQDLPDVIYKTKRAKYKAVVEEIVRCHQQGQPVLVGTTSIVNSEDLSQQLHKRGIAHTVLNAKYHDKEAEIIAGAGQRDAVTIATNMAGRGTDIVLGEGVAELGGLRIIGTERHESRRIDNQLRGRSGRQGDPGVSQFFLSLEDDLLRLFGSDRISGIMERLGMGEDDPIEHALISSSIENAQKKVEARNFDIRKHVLQYDDVMNQQREVIYSQRRKVLLDENLKEQIYNMIETICGRGMDLYANEKVDIDDWDIPALIEHCEQFFLPHGAVKVEDWKKFSREELAEELVRIAQEIYDAREQAFTVENMRELEKVVMLKVVDSKWMEHLDSMDMLREGIGLRAYGQRDPLVEYKLEGYDMFQTMIENIQDDIVRYIYRVQVMTQPEDRLQNATENSNDQPTPKQPVHVDKKVGRNDACPCGSGKKYKNCCGQGK